MYNFLMAQNINSMMIKYLTILFETIIKNNLLNSICLLITFVVFRIIKKVEKFYSTSNLNFKSY